MGHRTIGSRGGRYGSVAQRSGEIPDLELGVRRSRYEKYSDNPYISEETKGLLSRDVEKHSALQTFRDIRETAFYKKALGEMAQVLQAMGVQAPEQILSHPKFESFIASLEELFQIGHSEKAELFIYKFVQDCLDQLDPSELQRLRNNLGAYNGPGTLLPKSSNGSKNKDKEKVEEGDAEKGTMSEPIAREQSPAKNLLLQQLLELTHLDPDKLLQLKALDSTKQATKRYIRDCADSREPEISHQKFAELLQATLHEHEELLKTSDDVGPIAKRLFEIIRKLLIFTDSANGVDNPNTRAYLRFLLQDNKAEMILVNVAEAWEKHCETSETFENNSFRSDIVRQRESLLNAMDATEADIKAQLAAIELHAAENVKQKIKLILALKLLGLNAFAIASFLASLTLLLSTEPNLNTDGSRRYDGMDGIWLMATIFTGIAIALSLGYTIDQRHEFKK